MNNFNKNCITLCISILVISMLSGQPEFQFSLQSWGSYTSYDYIGDLTTTQSGFGIRHARLGGKIIS